MINFEIERELYDLRAAIAVRAALDTSNDRLDERQKTEAEELVSIRSRALFSRFVDAALWGGVSPHSVKAVRKALYEALKCLSTEKKCIDALKIKIDDFNRFADLLTEKRRDALF